MPKITEWINSEKMKANSIQLNYNKIVTNDIENVFFYLSVNSILYTEQHLQRFYNQKIIILSFRDRCL